MSVLFLINLPVRLKTNLIKRRTTKSKQRKLSKKKALYWLKQITSSLKVKKLRTLLKMVWPFRSKNLLSKCQTSSHHLAITMIPQRNNQKRNLKTARKFLQFHPKRSNRSYKTTAPTCQFQLKFLNQ